MTLADRRGCAASLLRFPVGPPLRVVVFWTERSPWLQALFQWRDQLELKLMERTLEGVKRAAVGRDGRSRSDWPGGA